MEKREATYNFSAGPGGLPTEVLLEAQKELLNFGGSGMSFMEMSHRDAGPVHEVMEEARNNFRTLLDIPDNYSILFFQSGAHSQFSAVPLNLTCDETDTVDYIVTGYWSRKAAEEAGNYCSVNVIKGVDEKLTRLTPAKDWIPLLSPNSKYTYICPNETMIGLEMFEDPVLPDDRLLVADFTSTLLSRKVNVSSYAVIFASGGKNLGPAGVCVVIVRKDLIRQPRKITPSILSWKLNAESTPIQSIYQTPPTFNIYICGLQWKHMLSHGGVQAFEERAISRAKQVYDIIDSSGGFYTCHVNPEDRSRMSVIFHIGNNNREMEQLFYSESVKKGFYQLIGHPLHPSLRIILYYGVPETAFNAVCEYLKEFKQQHESELK